MAHFGILFIGILVLFNGVSAYAQSLMPGAVSSGPSSQHPSSGKLGKTYNGGFLTFSVTSPGVGLFLTGIALILIANALPTPPLIGGRR